MRSVGWAVVCAGLAACSTHSFRLETTPPEATVYGPGHAEIGKTPLTLHADDLARWVEQERGLLTLQIEKAGYLPYALTLEPRFIEELVIPLTPRDRDAFRSRVLVEYMGEAHRMVADFLNIQGLLGARRFAQAQSQLDELRRNYPSLAAVLVLQADLHLAQHQREEALKALRQARLMAPDDPQIQRALTALEGSP